MFFEKKIKINQYKSYRKFAYEKRLNELIASPKKIHLSQMNSDVEGRFNVDVDGHWFDCFLTPGIKRSLVIYLSAAGRGASRETKFDRYTWHRWSNSISLSIEDPMYKRFKDVKEGWYLGDEECDYIDLIKKIVERMCHVHGISNENVTFIGSSAAGSAALSLADRVHGSTAVAFNPQLIFLNWRSRDEFLKATGIDLNAPLFSRRNNLFSIKENHSSKFLITFNSESVDDFNGQIKPFFESSDYFFGLNDYGNIKLIIGSFSYFKPHNVFLSPNDLSLVMGIAFSDIDEYKKRGMINCILEEVNNKFNKIESDFFSEKIFSFLKKIGGVKIVEKTNNGKGLVFNLNGCDAIDFQIIFCDQDLNLIIKIKSELYQDEILQYARKINLNLNSELIFDEKISEGKALDILRKFEKIFF